MAEADPLHQHGTNQYTRTPPVGPDDRKVLETHGIGSAYLAARVRRDAPEVAARIGEFTSIAAAAREAGIPVPKPDRVVLDKPDAAAERTAAKGDDYALAIFSALGAKLRDRGVLALAAAIVGGLMAVPAAAQTSHFRAPDGSDAAGRTEPGGPGVLHLYDRDLRNAYGRAPVAWYRVSSIRTAALGTRAE